MAKNQSISPLVSIIIPVFNVETYVDQCLRSVHNQTYKRLEIIIVNDGSTDNSLKVCKNWADKDNRITIIEEKNSGLSAARNNGLSISSGKYVLFIDSDDWLRTNAVEKMVNTFYKYDADMVTCQFFYYNGEPHVSYKPSTQVEVLNKKEYVEKLLKDNEVTAHIWRKMFKKELLPQSPFWEGHMFEDIVAMPGLVDKCNKFVLIADPLYYYRSRSNSFVRMPSKSNITEQYKSTRKALKLYQNMNLGEDVNKEIISYGFIRYWTILCGMINSDIKDENLKKSLIQKIRKCPIRLLHPRAKVICSVLKVAPASVNILCKIF